MYCILEDLFSYFPNIIVHILRWRAWASGQTSTHAESDIFFKDQVHKLTLLTLQSVLFSNYINALVFEAK